MEGEFALKLIELTVAITDMKSYVKRLEDENKRLKAQNEILLNLLKQYKEEI